MKNLYELVAFDLRMFDGNTNVTTDVGLSDEMKTYYSDYLIDLTEPKLVHDQFGQKHPIPKNGGGGRNLGVGGLARSRPTVGPPTLRGPVIGAGHVRQRDSRRKTLRRPFGRERPDQAVEDP